MLCFLLDHTVARMTCLTLLTIEKRRWFAIASTGRPCPIPAGSWLVFLLCQRKGNISHRSRCSIRGGFVKLWRLFQGATHGDRKNLLIWSKTVLVGAEPMCSSLSTILGYIFISFNRLLIFWKMLGTERSELIIVAFISRKFTFKLSYIVWFEGRFIHLGGVFGP